LSFTLIEIDADVDSCQKGIVIKRE